MRIELRASEIDSDSSNFTSLCSQISSIRLFDPVLSILLCSLFCQVYQDIFKRVDPGQGRVRARAYYQVLYKISKTNTLFGSEPNIQLIKGLVIYELIMQYYSIKLTTKLILKKKLLVLSPHISSIWWSTIYLEEDHY